MVPEGVKAYLRAVDTEAADSWFERHDNVPQDLVEFGGRLCYRSWKPGLNPNVTKIRDDQQAYLRNIISQRHGSVLEHVTWSFVLADVSRVFTHELVRHRAGTAISQESMRYVRLDDIPMWLPDWARDDQELVSRASSLLAQMEGFQRWAASHFGLDDESTGFHFKKLMTSFMRRFAPDGLATAILWTANARTLRHVIEARTALGAEEEIRLVFGMIAEIMKEEAPDLFADFWKDDAGQWVPKYSKV